MSSHKPVPEISICMIVRNEAPRLAECLRSFRPCADELVVVDTGSTDRTREIAQQQGARVFEMPWPDSFAAARNESIRLARGRWILWVDADDVGDKVFAKGVREAVRSCPQRNAAYHVAVRIPPHKANMSGRRPTATTIPPPTNFHYALALPTNEKPSCCATDH